MEEDTIDAFTGKGQGRPYKIVDYLRQNRKGLVASSLEELIDRGREKLGILEEKIKIVLEQDGTEVDDDEYFSTIDKNTSMMLLVDDQKWLPPGKMPRYQIIVDEADGSGTLLNRKKELSGLVDRLHGDLTHISMLGGKDLELLSDMDPDSLADIMPDKIFLDQLKEASSRFLMEKRQAQDALQLLKMYSNSDRVEPGQSVQMANVKKRKM